MGGALLGIDLGFTGPNYSISTACATSNNSIVSAAEHIQRGDADLMLCGGSEASIVPMRGCWIYRLKSPFRKKR